MSRVYSVFSSLYLLYTTIRFRWHLSLYHRISKCQVVSTWWTAFGQSGCVELCSGVLDRVGVCWIWGKKSVFFLWYHVLGSMSSFFWKICSLNRKLRRLEGIDLICFYWGHAHPTNYGPWQSFMPWLYSTRWGISHTTAIRSTLSNLFPWPISELSDSSRGSLTPFMWRNEWYRIILI